MGQASFSNLIKLPVHGKDSDNFFSLFSSKTFRSGAVVVFEQNTVFVIKEGEIKNYFLTDERMFTLSYLKPGDLFVSHADTQLRAMEKTVLWHCPIHKFNAHLMAHPEYALSIIHILGGILTNSMTLIKSLVFQNVFQRVTGFLSQYAYVHGEDLEGGVVIRLNLTMEELADMVGSSRQTVSQIMNRLVQRQIIKKMTKGVYFIENIDKLSDIVC